MLIRLLVTTGTLTCGRNRSATSVKALRGTDVTIVGTRASCLPMPVEMMVAPAASISVARARISSQVCPPSTRSRIDRR